MLLEGGPRPCYKPQTTLPQEANERNEVWNVLFE